MNTRVIIQPRVFALVITFCLMPRAWCEKDCHGERLLFMHKCDLSIKRGIAYMHPNDNCCRTVRKIDMLCVCESITPQEEERIDVHHAYFVSQDCHKPVPTGNKCGSNFLIHFGFLII
ncbi:hypothetical protein HU200_015860 [Digitaria exilis]|uniref:Bifunctional inhibitor/plant lipid transfer protein/seed storage helical domain-containing protein n=1 Tax=Digitaria exilis TaxID=1010633 RepID=A0A835F8U0_9POAL|nr:hypothetical protein HU200_015860 [Digitaria exilis]